MLGNVVVDLPLSDTYFVVAHFHLVMGVSAIYGMFAGVYHWFPKMYGRMMIKELSSFKNKNKQALVEAGKKFGMVTQGTSLLVLESLDQYVLYRVTPPKSLPKMIINPEVKNIFEFTFKDFNLVEYNPHPHIPGRVSV